MSGCEPRRPEVWAVIDALAKMAENVEQSLMYIHDVRGLVPETMGRYLGGLSMSVPEQTLQYNL